ncbi:MAG: selenocysteine-specific translation elongation factor [Pseudomonadales bacterium]
MIVALAGHVDHGKTSLIRALTGVETDRLQQEVARGLTIDLGFAYWGQGEQRLGFVDVPGHHRFIHNMLAGVSTHQAAMLVVAADDGVMPQTREHLAIMQLLGLGSGLIVVNKIDRADAERRAQVEAQIRKCVAGSFLQDAPLFEVSATTGEGIESLRTALLKLTQQHSESEQSGYYCGRMPIDRAFSYKGVGTVVTGTLHAGQFELEQALQLFPSHAQTRVRSLRVNNQPAERAHPGDRVAVNLAGIDSSDAKRGMWLHAGHSDGHRSLVIELEVLADYPRSVKHWTPVHVYHGSAHSLGQLALLPPAGSVEPGARALAELVCDDALLAARGDRTIIRDHGLDRTLGGGRVLSVQPAAARRRAAARIRQLEQQSAFDDFRSSFTAALSAGVVNLSQFQAEWDLANPALTELCDATDLLVVEDIALRKAQLQEMTQASLERFQALSDNNDGLAATQFCVESSDGVRALILKQLIADERLELRSGRYYPPNAAGQLSTQEQQLLDRLLPHLAAQQPPSLGDIGKQMQIPADRLRKAVAPLAGKGHIVLFGNNRIMTPTQFRQLAELAIALQEQAGAFSVKTFRDASGLGRNLVIDVLEHMDAGGFTRRYDNTRKVVGQVGQLLRR